MAENLSMALAELLREADAEPNVDTLREGVRVMTQALMELEVAQHLGAQRYQRRGAARRLHRGASPHDDPLDRVTPIGDRGRRGNSPPTGPTTTASPVLLCHECGGLRDVDRHKSEAMLRWR